MIDWVVKTSKLCNLRCRYCYEWDHLASRERMSLETWEALLKLALQAHTETRAESDARDCVARFVWHGGEPLLLPRAYFDSVVALQASVFGAAGGTCAYENVVQTNLYALRVDLVRRLHDLGFVLGVSFDAVPGARVTGTGEPTEDRVLANIAKLDDLGVRYGLISVVAGHTAGRLESVYAAAKDLGCSLRLLPLFDGPRTRPMIGLEAGYEEVVDALARVFSCWLSDGCPIRVDPFDEILTTLTMHNLGLSRPPQNRASPSVIVVEPNGDAFRPNVVKDAGHCMGNVRDASWRDLLGSAGSLRCAAEDAETIASTCGRCRYFGACDGYPLVCGRYEIPGRGECPLYRPLLERVSAEHGALLADDVRAALAHSL